MSQADEQFFRIARIKPCEIPEPIPQSWNENRQLRDHVEGLRQALRSEEKISNERAKVISEKEFRIECLEDRLMTTSGRFAWSLAIGIVGWSIAGWMVYREFSRW